MHVARFRAVAALAMCAALGCGDIADPGSQLPVHTQLEALPGTWDAFQHRYESLPCSVGYGLCGVRIDSMYYPDYRGAAHVRFTIGALDTLERHMDDFQNDIMTLSAPVSATGVDSTWYANEYGEVPMRVATIDTQSTAEIRSVARLNGQREVTIRIPLGIALSPRLNDVIPQGEELQFYETSFQPVTPIFENSWIVVRVPGPQRGLPVSGSSAFSGR